MRKVLVCSPGLAHRRLTPTNSDALLFDDVMWVDNAEQDHAAFVSSSSQRGVEVVELHDVLAADDGRAGGQGLAAGPEDQPNQVGFGLVDETLSFLRRWTSAGSRSC